jgi:hypothetical protein
MLCDPSQLIVVLTLALSGVTTSISDLFLASPENLATEIQTLCAARGLPYWNTPLPIEGRCGHVCWFGKHHCIFNNQPIQDAMLLSSPSMALNIGNGVFRGCKAGKPNSLLMTLVGAAIGIYSCRIVRSGRCCITACFGCNVSACSQSRVPIAFSIWVTIPGQESIGVHQDHCHAIGATGNSTVPSWDAGFWCASVGLRLDCRFTQHWQMLPKSLSWRCLCVGVLPCSAMLCMCHQLAS